MQIQTQTLGRISRPSVESLNPRARVSDVGRISEIQVVISNGTVRSFHSLLHKNFKQDLALGYNLSNKTILSYASWHFSSQKKIISFVTCRHCVCVLTIGLLAIFCSLIYWKNLPTKLLRKKYNIQSRIFLKMVRFISITQSVILLKFYIVLIIYSETLSLVLLTGSYFRSDKANDVGPIQI